MLDSPDVWGAMVAAKFAQQQGLPAGNYWEPAIARALAKAVREGRFTRDEIELRMAFQLGLAEMRGNVTATNEQER